MLNFVSASIRETVMNQTQEEEGNRDKKPNTQWSHRPLVLISNFCGIVFLILRNCFELALLLSLLTNGETETEEPM